MAARTSWAKMLVWNQQHLCSVLPLVWCAWSELSVGGGSAVVIFRNQCKTFKYEMFLLWVSLFSFFSFACSAHLTLTLCFVLNLSFRFQVGTLGTAVGALSPVFPT